MMNDKNNGKQKEAKIVFMPAKYDSDISIPNKIIDQIPNKLVLFSSVQFLHLLPIVQKQLEDKGKEIITVRSQNFLYQGMISEKGQILGCNSEVFERLLEPENDFDAFLYIGDGLFHPKALLVNNRKDVYCYNPKTKKLEKLEKEIHDTIAKRKKGAVLKFLTGKNIGFLVTTKRGQFNLERAKVLEQRIKARWPDKITYTFICNEINFSELENFNFVDVFINTACSRIGHDDTIRSPKPIVNMQDIEELLL